VKRWLALFGQVVVSATSGEDTGVVSAFKNFGSDIWRSITGVRSA